MTKRIWVLGAFTVLVVLAFFVTGTDAQPGTVKKIVPGVRFREGDLMNPGHGNNIISQKHGRHPCPGSRKKPNGANLRAAFSA